MERRRLQIPSGMQDTLPGECAGKRRLESKLRRLFTLGGYQEIETPILEYYDALDDQTFGYRPEQVWKTFDPQGRILAVRPDSTIPAVRLASGRLKNAPLPLRLCYVQSAAKFHSETLSLLCEDTQAGVELMGEGSAQADAEVIALAVEALRTAGIRDFLIELGQVKFVSGFLEEAGLTAKQCAAVRDMMAHKNALDMQLYLDRLSIEADVSRRLMRLPQLFGDAAVLDEAEQAGLLEKLSRVLSVPIKLLFGGVKRGGKAVGLIAMNIAANILGLGNASTPLGIAAMKAIAEEEGAGESACDDMIMLAVLNTASLQIIPATAAALRSANGAEKPMDILPCVWIVTAYSVFIAVFSAKMLARFTKKR